MRSTHPGDFDDTSLLGVRCLAGPDKRYRIPEELWTTMDDLIIRTPSIAELFPLDRILQFLSGNAAPIMALVAGALVFRLFATERTLISGRHAISTRLVRAPDDKTLRQLWAAQCFSAEESRLNEDDTFADLALESKFQIFAAGFRAGSSHRWGQ